MKGTVLIRYPRSWGQWRKKDWHPHTDGYGRACWIRFNWPTELDQAKREAGWGVERDAT